jgi:hypothetical protein
LSFFLQRLIFIFLANLINAQHENISTRRGYTQEEF